MKARQLPNTFKIIKQTQSTIWRERADESPYLFSFLFYFLCLWFGFHSSSKARSVVGLVRPCSGRSEFERYATVNGNTAGLLSLLAFWRLSDSWLPVYLHHQLFGQLGSFRLNLAQVKQLSSRCSF